MCLQFIKGTGEASPVRGRDWLASSSPQRKLASRDVTALFGKEASGSVCGGVGVAVMFDGDSDSDSESE